MAKVTIVFALLLIALGLIGFVGTGSAHFTALIPTWIGLILLIGGILANSPEAKRRMIFMHINVTVALLGLLGTTGELIRGALKSSATGVAPQPAALEAKYALAMLLLVYVLFCVRSFIAARKARLADSGPMSAGRA
jgi:hypothetical protein